MTSEKQCAFCGKTFTAPAYKIYCTKKCRVNAAGKRYRDTHPGEYSKQESSIPKRESTISETVDAARSAGLSYGKYKAMQWAKDNAHISYGGK